MLTDQNAPTALTDSADADPNLTLQMQQKAAAAAPGTVLPAPPPLSMGGMLSKLGAAANPTAANVGTATNTSGGGIISRMLSAAKMSVPNVGTATSSAGGGIQSASSGPSSVNVGTASNTAGGGIQSSGAPSTSTLPAPPAFAAPTGGANDAGTGSTPTSGAKLPSPATPLPTGAGSQAPYTAADTALDSTILPNADPRLTALRGLVDNAAGGVANVDRVKLAKDAFNTFKSETDPAYTATLNDAARMGAAGGQVGSGQLRTRFGDIGLQRSRDLQNEQDRLIQGATEGSIQDSFNKLGALSGLEGQTYGEGAADRNELRQERGNKLYTGLNLLNAGSAGNPADYYAQMAKQLGMDPSALEQLTKAYASGS